MRCCRSKARGGNYTRHVDLFFTVYNFGWVHFLIIVVFIDNYYDGLCVTIKKSCDS